MATDTYDAIVIGGGHNGLIAASYLARARWRVLVLERRPIVGGACVTEEIFPGFKVSTGAYVVSLLQPKIIRDLKLEQFGYETLPRDPSSFSPLPGNRHLLLWKDDAATQKEIARFSTKDAERYVAFNRHLEELVAVLEPILTEPPPKLDGRSWGDWLGWARWLLPRRQHGWNDRKLRGRLTDLTRLFTLSVAEYLDRWFESEELKVRLSTDGVIGLMAGPRTPGTAYGMFHHLMGQADGVRGAWSYVRGGMGGLTQAIAHYLVSQKGEVLTNAEVQRVLVKGQQARGVVLKDGREFKANVVVSNADPKRTFLGMFDELDLPESLVAEIKSMRFASGSTKINIAAKCLPDFAAYPGRTSGPQHRGTIHFSPSMDYIERAYEEAKWGKPSSEPFIEMGVPSVLDSTLTPPGKHFISCFVQYAPYKRADGREWDRATEKEFADKVFNVIRQYVTNWDDVLEDYQILTPPRLEEYFGLTGGNIFHGELTPDRLFHMRPASACSRYGTPISGFYICGAGAHPGGGVMGLPGALAARMILSERSR